MRDDGEGYQTIHKQECLDFKHTWVIMKQLVDIQKELVK